MPSVIWFRRDLRLNDHPALNAAIDSAFEDGDKNVVALFNIDPKVFDDAGNPLKAYQDASLKSSQLHLQYVAAAQHDMCRTNCAPPCIPEPYNVRHL